MEMGPVTCYDCPVIASHILLVVGVAAILAAVPFGLKSEAWFPLAAFSALTSCLLMAGTSLAIAKWAIDWRWSRSNFSFVLHRHFDRGLSLALVGMVVVETLVFFRSRRSRRV